MGVLSFSLSIFVQTTSLWFVCYSCMFVSKSRGFLLNFKDGWGIANFRLFTVKVNLKEGIYLNCFFFFKCFNINWYISICFDIFITSRWNCIFFMRGLCLCMFRNCYMWICVVYMISLYLYFMAHGHLIELFFLIAKIYKSR